MNRISGRARECHVRTSNTQRRMPNFEVVVGKLLLSGECLVAHCSPSHFPLLSALFPPPVSTFDDERRHLIAEPQGT